MVNRENTDDAPIRERHGHPAERDDGTDRCDPFVIGGRHLGSAQDQEGDLMGCCLHSAADEITPVFNPAQAFERINQNSLTGRREPLAAIKRVDAGLIRVHSGKLLASNFLKFGRRLVA